MKSKVSVIGKAAALVAAIFLIPACAPKGSIKELSPRDREKVIKSRFRDSAEEPDNPEKLVALARALQDDRQFAQAIYHYRKALELAPGNAQYHNMLGTALDDSGNLQEAMVEYEKAMAIDPTIPALYYNIGSVHHEEARVEEAIRSYKRALELDRNYADAWYNLGKAEQAMRRVPEAIGAYNRYLLLEPPDRDVKRWRKYAEDSLRDLGVTDDEIRAILKGKEQLARGVLPGNPSTTGTASSTPEPIPEPVPEPPAPELPPAPEKAPDAQPEIKRGPPPGKRLRDPPPMPEWPEDHPNHPKNRVKQQPAPATSTPQPPTP